MVAATKSKLIVTDLTPRIGSELRVDVDALLSGEFAAEIRDILERRGVVLFRLGAAG